MPRGQGNETGSLPSPTVRHGVLLASLRRRLAWLAESRRSESERLRAFFLDDVSCKHQTNSLFSQDGRSAKKLLVRLTCMRSPRSILKSTRSSLPGTTSTRRTREKADTSHLRRELRRGTQAWSVEEQAWRCRRGRCRHTLLSRHGRPGGGRPCQVTRNRRIHRRFASVSLAERNIMGAHRRLTRG